MDLDALRTSGGLYWPDMPEWHDDGAALLAFRQGGHAAEQAYKSNPLFCLDPASAAPGHSDLVKHLLIPRDTNN